MGSSSWRIVVVAAVKLAWPALCSACWGLQRVLDAVQLLGLGRWR